MLKHWRELWPKVAVSNYWWCVFFVLFTNMTQQKYKIFPTTWGISLSRIIKNALIVNSYIWFSMLGGFKDFFLGNCERPTDRPTNQPKNQKKDIMVQEEVTLPIMVRVVLFHWMSTTFDTLAHHISISISPVQISCIYSKVNERNNNDF